MSHEVGREILRQLGGSKFVAMTGARNLSFADDGVSMQVTGGIRVVIRLTLNDDYTITVEKKGKSEVLEGVYCDGLQETFTEMTGLDTHL